MRKICRRYALAFFAILYSSLCSSCFFNALPTAVIAIGIVGATLAVAHRLRLSQLLTTGGGKPNVVQLRI
jgi:hypothetical protein